MLTEVFQALGRRWYAVLVGMLATVALAYTAYAVTPTQYAARGIVLLLPSADATAEAGNPFLALSGLEQPAGVVVAYFASSSAQREVEALSPSAEYLIAIDDSTRGPAISVNVTDSTAASAIAMLDYLIDRVPEELARIQAELDVPSSAAVGSMALTADTVAEQDRSAMVRMVIAATGLGVLLTGAAAFTLDGMLLRRRQRRGAADTGNDLGDASERDVGLDTPDGTAPTPSPPERKRSDATTRTASTTDGIDDAPSLDGLEPVPARSRRG